MGELSAGQSVGSWKSNAGQAEITIKQEIGRGYHSQEAAAKAAFGKEALITEESDGQFHVYTIDDGAYLDDLDLGEKVTAKSPVPSAKVVDFVGDDGFQLNKGQKVYPPIGKDNGKVVYFMRHLSSGFVDSYIVNTYNPTSTWNEEITQARKKGYTVIMDPDADKQDMWDAFYDPRTAGVIFFGHGHKNGIVVGDGKGKETSFNASSLDAKSVSPNLKLVVFQSCETGKSEAEWKKATNGAKISGWTRIAPVGEINLNNNPSVAQAGGALLTAGLGPLGMLGGSYLAGKLLTRRLDNLIEENL